MSRIKEMGSASVELAFVFIIFAIIAGVVAKFSGISAGAHKLSIKIHDDIEKIMIEGRRPVCLEEMELGFVREELGRTNFGFRPLAKQLVFIDGVICK